MKHITSALAAVMSVLLICLGGAFMASTLSTSSAAAASEPCVPSDAWTETIEHPAGTHEETVHHDAVTHEETIEHPAVTEVVHHDAVTHQRYQYQKQVRGIVQQRDNGQEQWHTTGQGFDWEWWVGGSTQWSDTDVDVLESGPHSAVQETWTTGNGHHQWRKLTTEYRYVKNGVEETITDEEAYDETVVVTPAYTETVTVVDEEAYDETVVVVDEEAWTETIEHPAVECPDEPTEPPTDNPPTEEPPVVTPPVDNPPVNTPEPREPRAPQAPPTVIHAGL